MTVREPAPRVEVNGRGGETPWLARRDWAARRMVHSHRGRVIATWLATAAIVPLIAFLVLTAEDRGVGEGLWSLLGVGLVALAVSWTRVHLRQGTSVLELRTMPASPGGRLQATLHLRAESGTPIRLSLKAWEHKVRERKGPLRHDESRTYVGSEVVWESKTEVPVYGGRVAIDLPIPADAPGAFSTFTVSKGTHKIYWELTASTVSPFREVTFAVPVFRDAGPSTALGLNGGRSP